MNTDEIWKDIIGFEGLYQISNLGNVKSLDKIIHNRGRYKQTMLVKGKILSNKIGDVSLRKNNIKKTYDINTLKKIHFDNFNPKGDRKECIVNDEIITRRKLQQNIKLKKKDKTSKYVGVSLHKVSNKYRAMIMINKIDIHLGLFENEYDAMLMYKKAEKYSYLYKGVAKLFRNILNNLKD